MRIWVTGLGVVTPLGRSARHTMDALLEGKRAFGPVTLFDPGGCRSNIAAQMSLDASDVAPPGEAVRWSRTDAMAVLAAREALAAAEVGALPMDLILGGTTAGMFETEELLGAMHGDPVAWYDGARGGEREARMVSHPLSATVDRLRELAPFGKARTLCSACSSGANAILLAAAWLRTGKSERVLAGGADALCRLTYAGFSCLGALSPEPCRPFDSGRDGLNLGEGAAFLVLETEAAARSRGADPIAELRGWAVGAEAHHITNPEASGATASEVMARALGRARLAPDAIGYVNAHGTATKLNDAMESSALGRTFGPLLDRVAVSSSKGQIGHTLGAAGAVEAAITVMALARSVLPPTAGLENVDPDCPLDHVRNAREVSVSAAMSNSFGFGGSDAVLVFAKPGWSTNGEDDPTPRAVFVRAAATVGPLGVLDGKGSAAYLEPGDPPAAGALAFEAGQYLDLGKARRIDRAGRLCTAAMKTALIASEPGDALRRGAILGAAFGSVDSCAAFIQRLFEKGAKLASPAVFPNLLPSSPVAHASIYLGLRGAVFATADLQATALGAMVTAAELIAADEADVMLAGGIEEASTITDAVLGPLCCGRAVRPPRSEGAAVLCLQADTTGAIATVAWWTSWRGEASPLLEAPAPSGRAAVVLDDDAGADAALAGTRWRDVVRRTSAARAGSHECAGGLAAAAATGLLEAGALDSVLLLGLAPDRGYALLLERLLG